MSSFRIETWSAFAPGLETRQDWTQWLRNPVPIDTTPGKISLPGIPPLLRRRFGVPGKYSMAAAMPLVEGIREIPSIFASRHGDTQLSLDLLQEIARGEPMSPTSFSLAVHNAVGGLFRFFFRLTGARINRFKARFRRLVSLHLAGLWILLALSFFSVPAFAEHESLWELGIGVGTLSTPRYRGSKSEANVALPFPYVIYRGDILRVDRDDGIRGEIFENENLRFDLSLAGSIPVPDTDEGAREGMPGLDLLVEIGVEMNATLWRAMERDHRISFVMPLRMVYSVGDPLFEFQGLTLSPYLDYRIRQQNETMLATYGVSIGPIFASNIYHEYFYEVTPEFATPDRPAYDAQGGYGGSRITLSAKWHFKEFMIGLFARYDSLDGAVFEDSPLVETNDYFIVGTVFAWILNKSDGRGGH